MHISVAWLNRLLDRPVTPDEAERVLTHTGFPIETRVDRPGGDVMLDVEVTSNRGDVLSHVGCAREIAAATGRRLVMPSVEMPAATGGGVGAALALANHEPAGCPRFTARVIRGVKVGPSPAWLVRALEAVGQRSINNVVDVTNYIAFELGQPTHVFDLNKLGGRSLVVRFAREGEGLKTLDGKARTLNATDLVVADAQRTQSLAGIMGGADSEVDGATRDVVLEAATWDPVTIRTTGRRLGIRTDASHRFERRVHPATIDVAARRAAALIVEVAGGQLCEGMLDAGAPAAGPRVVAMRTQRCRTMLGYPVADEEMLATLRALGLEATARLEAGVIECVVPAHRLDLEREIDLIEEVARVAGLDRVPTLATLPVATRMPQRTEVLRRSVAAALTGLGFYETVTFSFVRPGDAAEFMPPGMGRLDIDDERRGEEPTLRPSVIPSLLRCRRANQDGQVEQAGGVRLFEVASVFAEVGKGSHVERRNLALVMDVTGTGKKRTVEDVQRAMRVLRGTIEQVVSSAGLGAAGVGVAPVAAGTGVHAACEPGASAHLTLGGTPLGYMALLSTPAQKKFERDGAVVYAEIGMDVLEAATPAMREVRALPLFPAIDRDLSIVVEERVPWSDVERVVGEARPAMFESLRYVTTFRDPQKVGPGRKSVSLRVRFRAGDRTLRSEEADAPMADLVGRLGRELGAVLRT